MPKYLTTNMGITYTIVALAENGYLVIDEYNQNSNGSFPVIYISKSSVINTSN